MIPILYPANETAFTTNGLGGLPDAISCVVTEQRNTQGGYYLEMEYPIDGLHFDLLAPERIIYAAPSMGNTPQPFRISRITRPINGIVHIEAPHVSAELQKIVTYGRMRAYTVWGLWSDFKGVATNIGQACPFTISSNFNLTEAINFWFDEPITMASLLMGMEGSMLDKIGGEIEFDKWNVVYNIQRGVDSGLEIRYGVNMSDLEAETDATELVTACVPYWKGTVNEQDVIVMGDMCTADNASAYAYVRCVPLDVSQQFDLEADTQPTAAQVTAKGQAFINGTSRKLLQTSIRVSYEPTTSGIGERRINLCDTVRVVYPDLAVSSISKVVETRFNTLIERYDELTIGTIRNNIVDTIAGLISGGAVYTGGGSGSGGGGSAVGAVLYNMPQNLNEAQKAQARSNIGVGSGGEAVVNLPFVTPEDYGAVGDGVTNDSVAIQSALNSGHPVLFEQKTYKIALPVEVDNVNGIVVDFDGAKIHVSSSASTTYGFVFHDCENILLQNLFMYSDLDQSGQSHESERETFSNVLGITFKDCSNIVCRNMQFENLSADFWMQHTNSQILIDGWISNNCAMPMYAERSQHMRVTNFYHKPLVGLSNYYHCFYLYGQTDDIQIDHGSMIAPDAYLGPLINCGYSQSSTTEKVTNLRVEECTMVYGVSAVWTQNVDEVSFSDCTILPVNFSAHRLASGSSDLSFKNCKIKIYQWGFQSGTNYNSKLLFDGCEIEGLHASSLISQNAYDLAFRNCTINGCSLAYHGFNSGKAIVKGCVIRCNSTITIENLFRNTSGQEVVFEDCYVVGNGTVRWLYYTGDRDSAGMRVHNCFAYNFRDITYNSESAEFIGVYLDGIPVSVKYAAFNRIPVSIDTDGTIFNQIGYIDGYRLGSGGVLREQSGSIVTGFMPFKNGDLYELSNMEWEPRSADGDIYCYITVFDSNFQYLGEWNNNNARGGVVKDTSSVVKNGSKYTVNIDSDSNQIAYLRVSAVWNSSMGTPTAIRKNKE